METNYRITCADINLNPIQVFTLSEREARIVADLLHKDSISKVAFFVWDIASGKKLYCTNYNLNSEGNYEG